MGVPLIFVRFSIIGIIVDGFILIVVLPLYFIHEKFNIG